MDKVVERFLKYVKYNTQSDENSGSYPSTPGQMAFAESLVKELEHIFTGGQNFHGKYEYIPAFAMQKAVEVIVNIAKLYAR